MDTSIHLKREFPRIVQTLSGTTWFMLALLSCLCINSLQWEPSLMLSTMHLLFCSTRAWKAVPELLTHIPADNIQIRVPFYVQFFYSLALEFPVKTQFLSYLGQLIFYSSPSVKFPHMLVIQLINLSQSTFHSRIPWHPGWLFKFCISLVIMVCCF